MNLEKTEIEYSEDDNTCDNCGAAITESDHALYCEDCEMSMDESVQPKEGSVCDNCGKPATESAFYRLYCEDCYNDDLGSLNN